MYAMYAFIYVCNVMYLCNVCMDACVNVCNACMYVMHACMHVCNACMHGCMYVCM